MIAFRHIRLALVLGFSLVFFQTLHANAEVSDKERAGARATATSGIDAFQRGEWQQAIEYLERAQAIVHSPVHLAYIAQAQEELGKLVKAQENYLKVLRDTTSGSAADHARATADERLRLLQPRIPKLTVQVSPADAKDYRVLVDDEELSQSLVGVPVPADPGERHVTARRGDAEVTETITLEEGGEGTIILELPNGPVTEHPPDETTHTVASSGHPGLRYAAYASLGVGVIGVGVGTVFGILSNSKNKKGDKLCDEETGTDSCSGLPINDPVAERVRKLDNQVKTATVVSVVGFGVGAVGLGTGVALLVLSSQKGRSGHAKSIQPIVSPNYIGLAGSF